MCREPCVRREVFPSGGTCSLPVELPGETIEPESSVCMAVDSKGDDRVSEPVIHVVSIE